MTDIDKMCTESFKHSELDNYRKLETRGIICQIEQDLKSFPGAVEGDSNICPLEHSFSDGIYVRKIFIPKGVFVVGKIHKHDHPNFLLEGEVSVLTEEEKEYFLLIQTIYEKNRNLEYFDRDDSTILRMMIDRL